MYMDASGNITEYRLQYYPKELYYKVIDLAGNILTLDKQSNIINALDLAMDYYPKPDQKDKKKG